MLNIEIIEHFSCYEISQIELLQMREKVENFLRTQLADDPLVASTLIIFSLNGLEKRQSASETIQKYLRNLIENPDETKFHRIRVNNKIFQVIF